MGLNTKDVQSVESIKLLKNIINKLPTDINLIANYAKQKKEKNGLKTIELEKTNCNENILKEKITNKILHKCDFEKDEHDLYLYCPKVSKQERNNGCEDMEEKKRVFNGTSQTSSKSIKDVEERFTTAPAKNNHPTLKPISLNRRILELFKTPNPQKIIYPFAGSFSEVIGGYQAGFKDFIGCEISEEYIKIGEARFKHYTSQKTLF